MTQPEWREQYQGGSPQAEQIEFARLANEIMKLQLVAMHRAKATTTARAFHAKPLLATGRATLQICDDISPDLCAGWVQPGRTYPTIVRFSNASPIPHRDAEKDVRGVALRVAVSQDEQHDLLMTNFPVSHARDARQFVAFAKATAGGPLQIIFGIASLIAAFGISQTLRMLRNISRARTHINSLASATFWSRGAYKWGEMLAVRFLLAGTETPSPEPAPGDDPQYLSSELAARLAKGDVTFTLFVQRYRDEKSTPIEDTSVEWTEKASPPERVAILRVEQQDTSTAAARADAEKIEALRFNPWNTTDDFRPLGNLNRARKIVYDAGSAQRLAYRWVTQPPLRNVIFSAISRGIFRVVNRFVAWHRLPPLVALLNLDAFRHVLRSRNLIDTDLQEVPPKPRPTQPEVPESDRAKRTLDGTFNDLSAPQMGAHGAVFGRNVRPIYRPDLFDEPNPIVVSERLLARERFIPATSLNILAAAWIQFQVHDWVVHERYPLAERSV
ncbi:MAG TPA: peroxidase family protein, partial [Candidatus Cybelea sp.]|nr:peroxidase family protein [Candidatus Cybelea sp.]